MLTTLTLITSITFTLISNNESSQWDSLTAKSMHVKKTIPTLSKVVLVSTENEFLDELSLWSKEGRWPILFLNDPLAWQFIQKFNPETVVRIRKKDKKNIISKTSIEKIIDNLWNPNKKEKWEPSGLVLMSMDDPAWIAGTSLAVGRGQAVGWLDASWGKMGETLSQTKALDLVSIAEEMAKKHFTNWEILGDNLDAITICKNISGTAKWNFNKTTRPYSPPNVPGASPELVAITDLIGRHLVGGERWAITGLIFGNTFRSTRIAMSSLFLDRTSWWLMETYPNQPPWNLFNLKPVHEALAKTAGRSTFLEQTAQNPPLENSEELQKFISKNPWGINSDIFLINSQGEATNFGLGHQKNTNKISANYLPISINPSVISMTHSWSARNLTSKATIAGRLIDRGCYCYIGSVVEPGLSGFKPPAQLVNEAHPLGKNVPFIAAARIVNKEVPTAKAWMIQTFGDPLMLLGNPSSRINKSINKDRYIEIKEEAKKYALEAMKAIQSNNPDAGPLLEKAAKSFLLSNKNVKGQPLHEYLLNLWKIAESRNIERSKLAQTVFPALYQLRNRQALAAAALQILKPTLLEQDMTWSALGSNLQTCSNIELKALLKTVRNTAPHVDLHRIDELVAARLGGNILRDALNAISKKNLSNKIKKEINQLQRRWGN